MYDRDGFAIAIGKWEDGSRRVAVRWNGEGDKPGHPHSRGNPLWFQMPVDLSSAVLGALLDRKAVDNKEIARAIEWVSAT